MIKPYGASEFDGYPSANIPKDRKPLPKEEEDKIIEEMKRRIREIAFDNETQELKNSRKIS